MTRNTILHGIWRRLKNHNMYACVYGLEEYNPGPAQDGIISIQRILEVVKAIVKVNFKEYKTKMVKTN